VILFNGALFGALSMLAMAGATAIRYWEEIHFEPHSGAIISGTAAAVGLVMFLAGRAMKGHEQAV